MTGRRPGLPRQLRAAVLTVGLVAVLAACGTAPTPTGGSSPSTAATGAPGSPVVTPVPADTEGYDCTAAFDPGSGAGSAGDRLGVGQDTMGRNHVAVGTRVTYPVCPPASGPHYSAAGAGPIGPGAYGPDDGALPQGWIHNLEHGSLVVLYRCAGTDACTDAGLARHDDFVQTLPNSPVCGFRPGEVGPVVARFEELTHPYAALVWGRVLYLETFDVELIHRFWATEGEGPTLPELLCGRPG